MDSGKIRKKKTFRHSTTFYRKLELETNIGVKRYFAVNKSLSTNISTRLSLPASQVSVPNFLPSLNVLEHPDFEYGASERIRNEYEKIDDYVDDDELFIPAEDYPDDETKKISGQILLSEQLLNWHHSHNITHSALNDLLRILKSADMEVPLDSRTILKTPKSVNIITMANGQFWYNGIENCLQMIFSKHIHVAPSSISLVFNIDGLPPFRSSAIEFWPILCRVDDLPQSKPMVIAIYCGETKPPLQHFLTQFVDELNSILKEGVIVEGRNIKVKIKYFVCDTPARNFLKGTVGFNSAHGCIKCTVIGVYDKGGRHMSFPRFDCPLRTDISFRQKIDEDHHKEDTPLLKLPIDMVEDIIVADSLHLFDLGIMRKCLYGWIKGSYNFRTKLSAAEIESFSDMLQDCNSRKPLEINRAIRRLNCLKFWKGTEYRTFLLYIGPVVLKNFLCHEAYHNFLTLFSAVTIISCNAYLKYIHIAECLFQDYIEQFIDIYGIDAISSNVHNLCHVTNDVRKFGPLPQISSYPFENFLGHLKSLLHTGNRPLPQLAKRVMELSKFHSLINPCNSEANNPFVTNENRYEKHELVNCDRIFSKLCINNDFTLTNDKKNQWFMTKSNDIVSMINATYYEGNICIYGRSIKEKNDFFEKPIKSSHLNIYESNGKMCSPKLYSLKDIKCKLVSFKYRNLLVFIPLIHTLDIVIP